MLKRFGGKHPNIVTLLATIARRESSEKEQYYLLFPWAESDLLGFWEKVGKLKRNHDSMSWIASQCYGIIEALAFIHDPKIWDHDGKRLFGRHGDIKPENVLWFKCFQHEILVLSDLGLAAEHRDISRSNLPGEKIPLTPNYRPPECDIEGPRGLISRSFDIWTLGCLFLEFIVWALCGWDGTKQFSEERFSRYINGVETNIYFEIVRSGNGKIEYSFKIKDKVEEASKKISG